MTKFVRMLNNSSDMLNEILEVGGKFRNMKAIWFDYSCMNKKV